MPETAESWYLPIAGALRAAADTKGTLRIRGAGTKMSWGGPGSSHANTFSTLSLDRVVEHNSGDLTAVVQAGVRLADAQKVFSEAGQMLAIDTPLADDATVGGIVATADSGPLRHGYGGVRDQVIGIRAALADGSVVHSGGKVIKNVAGYDLGKIFCGSFGTLGVIVEVSLRLHPLPPNCVSAVGGTSDPAGLGKAALALSNSAVRAFCLDFAWSGDEGSLLARFSGGAAGEQAEGARGLMAEAGLQAAVLEDDETLWEAQRAAQRTRTGVMLKVSALPADIPLMIEAAQSTGGSASGRAGLGIAWIMLPEQESVAACRTSIEAVRKRFAPRPVVVQDAPEEVRKSVDVWGPQPEGALRLMRRLKEGFDPSGVCNLGIFVGEI